MIKTQVEEENRKQLGQKQGSTLLSRLRQGIYKTRQGRLERDRVNLMAYGEFRSNVVTNDLDSLDRGFRGKIEGRIEQLKEKLQVWKEDAGHEMI